MAKLQLQVVTAERQLLDEEADMVIAPGGAGELGILPRHMPLITTLKPGELRVLQSGEEHVYAVAGGFMEVRHAQVEDAPGSQVIVLADAAERAEEIDIERAQEARRRAEEQIASSSDVDLIRAQAALLRAIARIRAAERARGRRIQA
ncbi:MAG TPA: F0F1 ATP synthase subunit epsilon [Chloroflexota bacterium]|nr:F0F1 ATP synthase subunit epsilon [Chloroflexota bacterium]